MSTTKSSSKHSSNDNFYLCAPSTDQDIGPIKQSLVTSAYSKTPPSTQDRSMREGLGDYLQNIPGDLNSSGPAEWSLQHLILNPPRAENQLSHFSGTQFMGFILKEGEPIPDIFKMEPSYGVEKLKKKHKSKKHKINQQDSLNHLLDKMPPDVPTPTPHSEPKQESSYGSATDIRRKDKKPKKSKKKKDEKTKKKKKKEDDDRPDAPSYSMNYHYAS